MRRRVPIGIVAAVLALASLPSCGAAEQPEGKPSTSTTSAADGRQKARGDGLALQQIGNFDSPVYITGAPGYPRLLFVVEQGGKVVALRNGRRLPRPFLDITGPTSFEGERGLLSIAFPPDYQRSRRFYVYYTDSQGDIRVEEFKRRSATQAARGSGRLVIEIPHRANSNHNGGQLQFLGNDLYLATGDGGAGGDPPNNAQNKNSLLGKLLRIDPRASDGHPYSIPSGNPFVGQAGRGEIYSYGLRNPFRFSFDQSSGDGPRIAIADVGQEEFEELDYLTVGSASGANFGWDAFEGSAPYEGASGGTRDPGGTVKPIFAYSHSRGGSCTIIGGYVVRDPRLPSLRGRYVYADLCEGELRGLLPALGKASGDRKLGLSVSTPSSFGEDTRGRVYIASLEGPVYRLVAK